MTLILHSHNAHLKSLRYRTNESLCFKARENKEKEKIYNPQDALSLQAEELP